MIAARIAERLADWPGLELAADELLARDAPGLEVPDHRSANRQCCLLRAADGWIALNLARPDDAEMVPLLAGRAGEPWEALSVWAAGRTCAELRTAAIELQLPVAVVGEAAPQVLNPVTGGEIPHRVIDLSALWAGPLCGALLARAGAEVIRIESLGRPDPTPVTSPELHRRLNGAKQVLPLDLRAPDDRARLLAEVARADALITSARPAALARLGLTPEALFAANPALIWAAITAHGWTGPGAERVGFGDDCAVAGNLLDWRDGSPRFRGDALADPLTGVEAALAVRGAVRGGLIDLAMAGVAAGYAAALDHGACPTP
jgi:hypothetical protein